MNAWYAAGIATLLTAAVCQAQETATVTTELRTTPPVETLEAPTGPDAASEAEDYFALGAWRIGMPREEALKHVQASEPLTGEPKLRVTAPTHFAGDLPAEVVFADGRLQSVKLQVYEGTDLEQAIGNMQTALLYMNAHFGGANFEGGLKTHKDPRGELLRQVVRQTLDKFDAGLREVDEKERKSRERKGKPPSYTAYEMVMNFWTELVVPNNFLTGEFRYRSDLRQATITLYDDRAFVESRIPKASVNLFRVSGERPSP
jgi:hypothetical protein